MELSITPQDAAGIVALIAPGYFAIQAYSSVHAKTEKNFSRVFVESVAFSLPIVGVYNFVWRHLFSETPIAITGLRYFIPLILFSILVGSIWSWLRHTRWTMKMAGRLGVPGPDDDFMRTQFKKLPSDALITATLRNGEVFSGSPQGGSAYKKGQPRDYFFSNVAWYDKDEKAWVEKPGSLIVSIDDIHYIETQEILPSN